MTADRAAAVALRRLLPLLVVMHFISYVDRVNITFAENQLERDLGLSGAQFGLAAGIFFVGFVAFAVPSNLMLDRAGARRWLAVIMAAWGVAAMAGALAWSPGSLVGFRVLLGVAEAGFFPGVMYFLACWFPDERRGQAVGLFLLGIVLALVLGGPLAGALLELDGVLGIEGWRWLFVLEGLPAIAVAGFVLRVLPNRPTEAEWLAPEEGEALERKLAEEREAGVGADAPLREVLRDRRVILLAAGYFWLNFAGYGAVFWLADIVERIGDLSDLEVGLIAAIPFTIGASGLWVLGRRSDRMADRRPVIVGGLLLGAAGMAGIALLPPVLGLLPSALAVFGTLGAIPAFWGLAGGLLGGRSAAASFAVVNSVGVIGGLPGPVAVGVLKDATGSLDWGLLALGGACLISAALVVSSGASRLSAGRSADPGPPAGSATPGG